jgi:hypothetical protein
MVTASQKAPKAGAANNGLIAGLNRGKIVTKRARPQMKNTSQALPKKKLTRVEDAMRAAASKKK